MNVEIRKILVGPNPISQLDVLAHVVADSDAFVRLVGNVLAVLDIPVVQKDKLRADIRAWYRSEFGDRAFFADSKLNMKVKK